MAKVKRRFEAEKTLPDENGAAANVKIVPKPKTSNLYNQYSNNVIKPTSPNVGKNAKEDLQLKPSVRNEKKLFQKLKRMITGPDVLPNMDQYIQGKMTRKQAEKVARYEEYFKKIQSMTYFGVMQNDGDRRLRYMEYDRMEWMSPEVGRALDALASDASSYNEDKNVISINCPHNQIIEEAEYLFYNILDINSNLFYWVRDTCKYGDSFFTLHIDAKDGIKKVVPAPVEQCEREVGYDEQNPFAHRFKIAGLGEEYLQPYEVAHFRLKASVDFGEYGKSVLENARRIWRQLITIEDSMIIYRLVRAPERRIFYFDVGNLSPESVEAAINKYSSEMKKEKIYDDEGNIDYRMSLQSVEEDIFIPTRGGNSNTRIETLPAQQWAVIDDVNYLHAKFIAALGVPNTYLGYEQALNSKSTLGNEDIRYSKYVERIQRSLLETLYDLLTIHLYIKGYKSVDVSDIEIMLTNPSHINELQQLEILASRLDLYTNAKDNGIYSSYWLKKNILDMADEEIEKEEINILRDNIVEFTKGQAQEGVLLTVKDVLDYNTAQNTAAANAMGMDGGAPGGFGGDMGGDMGGFDEAEIGGMENDMDTSMGDADDLADEVDDVDLEMPEI